MNYWDNSTYEVRKSKDIRGEKIVADYMDNKVYSQLGKVKRNNDKETQIKGVDLYLTTENKTYIIDEKAAIQWANKDLKTFALEISSVNINDYVYDGWFIDNKNINDYFSFIWLDKADIDEKGELVDSKHIHSISWALISKKALMDYLNSIGWTRERLIRKANEIRRIFTTYGKEEYKEHINLGNITKYGVKFTLQENKREHAVNILLPKEKIMELAEKNII